MLLLDGDGREGGVLRHLLAQLDHLHVLAARQSGHERPEELRRRLADAVVVVGEAALEGREEEGRGRLEVRVDDREGALEAGLAHLPYKAMGHASTGW